MTDLVVVVPSRGRPHTVRQLIAAFDETCTADTHLAFSADVDDPTLPGYSAGVVGSPRAWVGIGDADLGYSGSGMVFALNQAAHYFTVIRDDRPEVIAFMGDDHRPRTKGWDTAYLDALRAKPGMVYGNDLIQGESLPTQVAMSTSVVQALGHMAPACLTHLYVDNYWLALGRAADCITYLSDVVVEHMHPVAGKAAMDEGYVRVNAPEMYKHDALAFADYLRDNLAREVALVRAALAGVSA